MAVMDKDRVDEVELPDVPLTAGEELVALGWNLNEQQYRLVHLAARFDDELEWFRLGCKSAAQWIATTLQMQVGTAREWIRVGHELRYLPLIDAAFAAHDLSYAKARILTRWADDTNEADLLEIAKERPADRLTVAIAKHLADNDDDDDEDRDRRLHEYRSFTTWTDGDGMCGVGLRFPPSIGKPIVAAVDELVGRIAATPLDDTEAGEVDDLEKLSADSFGRLCVSVDPTGCGRNLSADSFDRPTAAAPSHDVTSSGDGCSDDDLRVTLRELRRRWQPDDGGAFPTLSQQRGDAFVALFLGLDINLTTEVVMHVRGDGNTFDDGTPITDSEILRHLDHSFIRLLIHDAERRPVNASSRRRHPTTRQKRVAMEGHGHECVDCHSTDLLEVDHNPPYEQTRRTITDELEPRCAPCHRTRHRRDRHAVSA